MFVDVGISCTMAHHAQRCGTAHAHMRACEGAYACACACACVCVHELSVAFISSLILVSPVPWRIMTRKADMLFSSRVFELQKPWCVATFYHIGGISSDIRR